MKIKRVWFVSHYSMPPEYEMRVKTLRYAHYLGLKGIDCTIYAASTLHNTDIDLISDNSLYIERQYDDLKYVHIRCMRYTKTDLRRIINMEQFGYRFLKVAERFDPPDVIVSDTYCISYKPIYRYCKRHSIPFVVDVRDLWPQSIVEYMHVSQNNPVIQAMYGMEKRMYVVSDRIIFSMDGGYDYIRDRHLDSLIPKEKVFYINNGVDIEEFQTNCERYRVEDEDLSNDQIKKLVYIGSVRKVNNVGVLLDIAKKIKNDRVRFLIWGDGDELPRLKERLARENIANVRFKGRVEKKYIPFITSMADINLIHNNPSDLFKYGISFNKIFDYLAAGRPTLSTFPCRYNPAVMAGAGKAVERQDPDEIAREIESMLDADTEQYCINARKAAQEYDFQKLTDRLLEILEGIS